MSESWTRVLPREDGWYWWRVDEKDEFPVILHVIVRGNMASSSVLVGNKEFDLYGMLTRGPVYVGLKNFDGGEWFGPLRLPSGGCPPPYHGIGACYVQRLKKRLKDRSLR